MLKLKAPVNTGLVIMCILAMVTLSAKYISPADNGLPALVALAYPFTFIFLLGFIVLKLMMRNYRSLLLGISVLIFILLGRNIFGITPPLRNDGKLKIVSFNVQAFGRYNKNSFSAFDISNWLSEENADIVCFQEYIQFKEGTNIMTDVFPYHAEGFARKDHLGESGTFILSKYPVINHGKVNIDDILNNILWADIKIGSDTLRVFNLHLYTTGIFTTIGKYRKKNKNVGNSKYDADLLLQLARGIAENNNLRSRQAEQAAKLIASSEYPVIVCGDFNDVPFSYSYNKVKGNLDDSFLKAGFGYVSTFRFFKGLFRIDNIFVSDKLRIKTYSTQDSKWSDHLPVISTVDFN